MLRHKENATTTKNRKIPHPNPVSPPIHPKKDEKWTNSYKRKKEEIDKDIREIQNTWGGENRNMVVKKQDNKRVKAIITKRTNYKNSNYLSLYSIDTHFNTSTTDSFLKHCGKRRNCS